VCTEAAAGLNQPEQGVDTHTLLALVQETRLPNALYGSLPHAIVEPYSLDVSLQLLREERG
jgi:hypothetical protein